MRQGGMDIRTSTDYGRHDAAMNANTLQQQQNYARFVRNFLEREGEIATEVCGWPYRTIGLHLPTDVLRRIRTQNFLDRLSPNTSRVRQPEEIQP